MEIRNQILKTICWFDLFDRPVSDKEINKYLIKQKSNLKNLRRVLRKMIGKEVSRKGFYYCLKGREKLFEIFKERRKISEKKWKKAKRVSVLLRVLPFIKAAAVTQNLAINNSKSKSDIDFFIITSKNKLWTTRGILNLKLDALRLRNQKKDTPICPNFLISSNRLGLEDLKVDEEDIYLAFWLNSLKPIFGRKYFEKILKENRWTKRIMPNIKTRKINNLKFNWLYFIIQKTFEIVFFVPSVLLENQLMKAQIKKIESFAKNKKGKSLFLDKNTAKIHYEDKRLDYLNKWERLVKSRT